MKKIGIKSIVNIIKKYAQEVTVHSSSSSLDKQTGKFTNIRTRNVRMIAFFKKNSGYIYSRGGHEKRADVKIYATDEIYAGDDTNRKPDEIEVEGEIYKMVSVEKRMESSPVVYICFGVLND